MKSIWIACGVMALASSGVLASETAAGKAKAKTCETCHGPGGTKSVSPDIPRLAGQHYDYLVKALSDYKSGARKNPIMAPQAANLSKRDIEDLAHYISEQHGLYVKY
jgi:cytochrome c553